MSRVIPDEWKPIWAIARTFVRWYVWWGKGAFYYYSRPLAWTYRLIDSVFFAPVREMERQRVAVMRKYGEAALNVREAERSYRESLSPKLDVTNAFEQMRSLQHELERL